MTDLNTTTAIPAATTKQRVVALATAFLNLEVGDFDQILEANEGDPRYAPRPAPGQHFDRQIEGGRAQGLRRIWLGRDVADDLPGVLRPRENVTWKRRRPNNATGRLRNSNHGTTSTARRRVA
jgi:hypothetical protein